MSFFKHPIFRFIVGFFTALSGLFILFTLLISVLWQRESVREYVKNQIVDAVQTSLSEPLHITSLNGDLWSSFSIEELQIGKDISVDAIELEYSFFDLIFPPHRIESFRMIRPEIGIYQRADSSFSLQHLLVSSNDTGSSSSVPSILIEQLQIQDAEIQLMTFAFGKPDTILIQKTQADLGIRFSETQFQFDVNEFKTDVISANLDDTLRLALNARATENRLSIGKLIVESSRSSFEFHSDVEDYRDHPSLTGKLGFKPLSWQDIRQIEATSPVKEDMTLRLSFSGANQNYSVQALMSSASISDLFVQLDAGFEKKWLVKNVRISAEKSNLGTYLGLDLPFRFQHFDLSVKGEIPVFDLNKTDVQASLNLNQLQIGGFVFDSLLFNSELKKDSLTLDGRLKRKKSVINIAAGANSITSAPKWQASVFTENLNLTALNSQAPFSSHINSSTQISGYGWGKHKLFPSFALVSRILPSEIAKTEIKPTEIDLRFDGELAELSADIHLKESYLSAAATMKLNEQNPAYQFSAETKRFNLAEIESLKEIPSALNLRLSGEGKGFSPKTMELSASVVVDSSRLLNKPFETLLGTVKIKNGRLSTEKFVLKSGIADALIYGSGSLVDISDKQNILNIQIELKDMQPLAPLMGLSKIQAQGIFNASLKPQQHFVRLQSLVAMQHIEVDSVLIGAINGEVAVDLQKNNAIIGDFSIKKPQIGQLPLWDFEIHSQGTFDAEQADFALALSAELRKNQAFLLESSLQASYQHGKLESLIGEINKVEIKGNEKEFMLSQPASLRFTPSSFSWDTLKVANGDAFVQTFGAFTDEKMLAGLRLNQIDLSDVYNALFDPIDAVLPSNAVLELQKKDDSFVVNAEMTTQPVVLKGLSFDRLNLSSSLLGNRLSSLITLEKNQQKMVRFQSDLPLSLMLQDNKTKPANPEQVQVDWDINGLDLADFQPYFDELDLGTIKGILHSKTMLTGTADQPELSIRSRIDSLILNQRQIDSVLVQAGYNSGKELFTLAGTVHHFKQEIASLSGAIPLSFHLNRLENLFPTEDAPISFSANASDFELNLLNDFFDERQINHLEGRVNANVQLSGTFKEPDFKGEINVSGASAEIVPQRITLNDISSKISLEKQNLHIQSLRLRSKTGFAEIQGQIKTKKMKLDEVNLNVKAKNFQLSDTRNLKLKTSSDLKISGNDNDLFIGGSINLVSSDIYLENFGEKSVEEIDLNNELSVPTTSSDALKDLKAQIKLTIESDVWVRNREFPTLNVELFGAADLVKNRGEDFQLLGTFETKRGYAKQFSKRFNLDQGKFTFSGEPLNPSISIETSYVLRSPSDVTIWYIVGGTVKKPTFEFKSDPEMELEDIISYTLFGKPFATLSGWQQGMSGGTRGTITDATIGLLLDQVETYATDKFGIDVIEIDNSASGADAGTSIRVGKYVNPRTFIALVQQLGGSDPVSQVVVEYLIQKNLDLILTQSSDEKSGVDLRWKLEY